MSSEVDKLSELNLDFIRTLPSRLDVLDTFWDVIEAEWEAETFDFFVSYVRRLEGSAAAFKLAMIVEATRPWLSYLREVYPSVRMDEEGKAYCRENLIYLRELSSYWNIMPDDDLRKTVVASLPELPSDNRKLVYLVDNDMLNAARMAGMLKQQDYRTRCFDNVLDFYMEFEQVRPDLVLMPMLLDYGTALDFLANFKKVKRLHVPVVGILGREDAQPSPKSMFKVGMVSLLRETLLSSRLADTVASVLADCKRPTYKVMLIDDGEAEAAYLKEIMTIGRFKVSTVFSVMELEAQIAEVRPDVLLVDMDHAEQQAGLSNFKKLAKQVPILFLSSEPSRDWSLLDEVAGAYSFLEKDIEPWSLISKVRGRIDSNKNRLTRKVSVAV